MSGHIGRDRTIYKANQIFHWRNMGKDIIDYIGNCPECNNSKVIIKAKMELHPIAPTSFFHQIGIDLIGRLVKTKNNNQ